MPENSKKKIETSPSPTVISTGNILLLCAAGAILAALLLWFAFGRIQTSYTIQGVLNSNHTAVKIHQPRDAVVTDICVRDGQYVQEGDVLLKIYTGADPNDCSLEYMARMAQDVTAPFSGFVTEIPVAQWARVGLSDTLAIVLEAPSKTVQYVLSYVPIDFIERISVGTEAIVNVRGGQSRSSGIRGTVIAKSDLPVSGNDMWHSTGSSNITSFLYEENVEQFEVMVHLDFSGFNTLKEAEARYGSLLCNEICDITFFSEELHPYQIVFRNLL